VDSNTTAAAGNANVSMDEDVSTVELSGTDLRTLLRLVLGTIIDNQNSDFVTV
jgi:hypothetical protein